MVIYNFIFFADKKFACFFQRCHNEIFCECFLEVKMVLQEKTLSFLDRYLKKGHKSKAAIAYLAGIDHLLEADPSVGQAIVDEIRSQRSYLKLIASENYSSIETQLAMGNLLTDKYSEGTVGRRFYAGCENVDTVEALACERLKKIFGADHVYVQPHSGADANLVAFWAILMHKVQDKEIEKLHKKNVNQLTDEEHEKIRQLLVNQKVMGLSLDCGGHLTHGFRMNVSSKIFKSVSYKVDPKTEIIDYAALKKQVQEEKPAIFIAGYSAYPRLLNFAKLKEITDSVGAVLMGDIAHFAGLVAGKAITGEFDPVPYCDVISSTTHKTLRGPRGGIVMCKNEFKDAVDKGCPMVLGGPLPHVMAAKAVAFHEALQPEFRVYAHQVIKNAKAMAETFLEENVKIFSHGTDNHLIVVDVAKSFGLNGKQGENALLQAGIVVNRNMVPFDQNGAWYTSGIRLGTPALTTLGLKEKEMKQVAKWMIEVLKAAKPEQEADQISKTHVTIEKKILEKTKAGIKELLSHFPLYPELEID